MATKTSIKGKNRTSRKKAQNGSVTVRKDGRIMARYTFKGRRYTFYGEPGESKSDVQLKLDQILLEIRMNRYTAPQSLTVETYFTDWLTTFIYPTVRKSTYASYEDYLYNHIIPALGKKRMVDLNKRILQEFFNEKAESGRLDGKGGLSAKSLSNLYNLMHYAFESAIQEDPPILMRNPLAGVRLAKGMAREMRVLSLQEQRSLEEVVFTSAEPNAFGILFTLYTGLRIGEVLGLMWRDLDTVKHTVTIHRTVQRVRVSKKKSSSEAKTEIVLEEPKTKTSKRIIPIFDELWEMLLAFKSQQKLRKLLAGSAYQEHDLIFCNPLGQVIEPRTFEDVFKRLTARAKIEDATFHSLRHTFATRALENGMDIHALSTLLGHAQPSTTLNLYCHCLPDHKRESMNKMQTLFSKAAKPTGEVIVMPDLRVSREEELVSNLVSG